MLKGIVEIIKVCLKQVSTICLLTIDERADYLMDQECIFKQMKQLSQPVKEL